MDPVISSLPYVNIYVLITHVITKFSYFEDLNEMNKVSKTNFVSLLFIKKLKGRINRVGSGCLCL